MGTQEVPIRSFAIGLGLHTQIENADAKVEQMLESGALVRACHANGSTNSSQVSTAGGSVKLAENIASQVIKATEDPESDKMFGTTIRRTIDAFKPLFRK